MIRREKPPQSSPQRLGDDLAVEGIAVVRSGFSSRLTIQRSAKITISRKMTSAIEVMKSSVIRGGKMAAKWLLKSDPEHYSFYDLERDGKTVWDGISNNLALKNLRNVRRGELVMVYHTGAERAVVGLAEAVSDPYPDPQQKDARLVVIDLRAKGRLARPVTLDEIKKSTTLKKFDLVRLPRLSVMPVSDAQWTTLLTMAGMK
jgi:predicted RNA-binding protein with PUA-like domain